MSRRFILLFGGKSHERDISTISAASVYSSLIEIGYEVTCIGITQNNFMYLQQPVIEYNSTTDSHYAVISAEPSRLVHIIPGIGFFNGTKIIDGDIVFPVMHGSFGEDGRVQALLDHIPLPVIGCNYVSSILCFSKSLTKIQLEHAGIPTVPYFLVHNSSKFSIQAIDAHITSSFSYPVFVKPDTSGSSIGISRVSYANELESAIQNALSISDTILIEKSIQGKELECSVIGDSLHGIFCTVPGEVIPIDDYYTFESKYTLHHADTKIEIPANIESSVVEKCQHFSKRAFDTLGCSGMARIDFLYDTQQNTVYINEINTIPGFTPTSMFIQLLKYSGFTWEEVLNKLIHSAQVKQDEMQYYLHDFPSLFEEGNT